MRFDDFEKGLFLGVLIGLSLATVLVLVWVVWGEGILWTLRGISG